MAIFTAINFLAHAPVLQGQRGHHLVEGRHPGPDHHHAVLQVPPAQLQRDATTANGGFFHDGAKALFAAIPAAGIVFAYLGFEQADQLAGEIKNPRRNLPRAIIIAT